jgi:diguanylate cyclase (GGDEF)-like protein
MKKNRMPPNLTTQEYRKFITTTSMASLLVLLGLQINILFDRSIAGPRVLLLVGFNACASLYIVTFGKSLAPVKKRGNLFHWLNAALSGLGLFFLAFYLPTELLSYLNLLILLAVVAVSILSGRIATLLMIFIGNLPLLYRAIGADDFLELAKLTSISLASLIIAETMARTQNIAFQQIHRLETINAFSRQVASTLDRAEILLLVSSAIPKAVEADSYYVGLLDGDEIAVEVFYDDGEYFNGVRVKAKGSLSGWVVKHQQELFLPDLRQPLDLEDVDVIVVGKDKTSLSWIGVPLTSNRFKGMLALASYQPNAFNRGDIELLANLAQHTAMALENAANHAEVQDRTRRDSLTGVLNHGYFLETLQNVLEEAASFNSPVSVIMLDVDYFKQYNDTYGHLIGDKVLLQLCETIRAHIKTIDSVGRWGGEEFIITLPGADGPQAFQVAERIQKTMRELKIPGRDGQELPAPTVSQGVAVFPSERTEMYELIDLADKRLYIAKSRGRNQIEPHVSYWELKSGD